MKSLLLAGLATAAITLPQYAIAQADTTRLEAVVVTADRIASSIASATAAVSRVSGNALHSTPLRTVADVLRLAPGAALVDFDGLGYDPQVMLRGFYGGGEAEYVLLLLDGRPLNLFETGRATWDQVPLSAIESVEIVRGGSSAAWGDAALAGVVNIRTRSGSSGPSFTGSVEAGSFREIRTNLNATGSFFGKAFSASAGSVFADGFRDHAHRSTGRYSVSMALIATAERQLNVHASYDSRSVDDPGPLSGDDLAESRRRSSPFFRFDETAERTRRGGIDFSTSIAEGTSLSAQLSAELRDADRVRTLVLSPDFADSKDRNLSTARFGGGVQLRKEGLLVQDGDDLLLGVDFSRGDLSSSYFLFTQGDEDAYSSAAPERGSLDARGDGTRTAAAGFAVYGLNLTSALRLSLGGRIDWLQDEFQAMEPSDAARHAATHVAFSPKFGLNWEYSSNASRRGNIYANVGRSFKSPTQEQLFDQRGIPVPFPPFSITFANSTLNPQFGTSYEAGVYQSYDFGTSGFTADITFSGYQIDLKDELDFDIATFQYQNIGRSRHRGIETGVTLHAPGAVSVFTNYTMQAPRSRSGDNEGKYLKAIPRHFLVAGAILGSSDGFSGSATLTSARKIFLDDANESELESWNRVDVRAGYSFRRVNLFVDVINALDSEYSTTGFPDPSGTATMYFHPAAGRSFRVGIAKRR